MHVDTISEAKAQLSALIERAMAGEEIIIKKAGKPVAILKNYDAHAVERHPGAMKGQIRIGEDFDDLPPNILQAFEGRET